MSLKELPKTYEPQAVEDEIYKKWESSGFFNPDNLPKLEIRNWKLGIKSKKRKAFSIIMPPPNANGSLHLGHAVFVTIQDIMIRYHRMLGEPTLWLPGADHAGFETQVVYDKKLEKEGRNRFQFSAKGGSASDLTRDQLYQEIWDFTQENKKIMEGQLRKLGASCDWSRAKFTLDPEIIKIVYATFKRLYDDGLAYRDSRLVNWCVKHQTSLSDLEVKHEDRQDKLYYINYGPLKVATVRPEPIFADVAVAVHPTDKRYKHLVGKFARIPLINKEIPIIADEAVDPAFGTGAVKITPSVDPNDFELAKKHGLPIIPIIDQFGRLTEPAPEKYRGLKVQAAREAVAADLAAAGALEKVDENYLHSVATCYKCNTILEPRVSPQWYVRMTSAPKSVTSPTPSYSKRGDVKQIPPLKVRGGEEGLSLRDMAVEAVKKGEVVFIPKRTEKVFMHWMNNLRDWNISRQIVWGIRIPVWYCKKSEIRNLKSETNSKSKILNSKTECSPIITDGSTPEKCPSCGGKDLEQETDVFDTWFSSGQWPFAVLLASGGSKLKISARGGSAPGGKNKKLKIPWTTNDFENFYPTTVMETAYDILFFWVARMIMFGKYVTGRAPFKYVYLHGLVRDKDRQKMSKSRGNVIDPLGVAHEYGTDAVRLALVLGNTAGNDIVISEDKIRGYRNFANKLWNMARFVLMNLDKDTYFGSKPPKLGTEDKKQLKNLSNLVKKVTERLNKFEFHHAGEKLYHYLWHEFADKIIEAQKPRLQNPALRPAAQYLLIAILGTTLKLLHPFMPYVTETIWQELPKKEEELLMTAKWPKL